MQTRVDQLTYDTPNMSRRFDVFSSISLIVVVPRVSGSIEPIEGGGGLGGEPSK